MESPALSNWIPTSPLLFFAEGAAGRRDLLNSKRRGPRTVQNHRVCCLLFLLWDPLDSRRRGLGPLRNHRDLRCDLCVALWWYVFGVFGLLSDYVCGVLLSVAFLCFSLSPPTTPTTLWCALCVLLCCLSCSLCVLSMYVRFVSLYVVLFC